MNRIDMVIPCICGSMPVLYVRTCTPGRQEYGAKCPVCGRGCETGVQKTNWSAYTALQEWNKSQARICKAVQAGEESTNETDSNF